MLRAGPQGKSRRASSLAGASPFNRIFTLRALLVAAALSAGVIYLLIKQVPSQFPQVSASDVHHPQSSSSEAGRQTSSEHTSHTEQHHTRTSPMATSTVADRSSSHAAGYNAAPVGRVVVVGGGLAGISAALEAAETLDAAGHHKSERLGAACAILPGCTCCNKAAWRWSVACRRCS